MVLSRECVFLGSLSRHNKDLERRTLKPSACHSSQVLDKPCYSSQANECYSSILFRRQQENPSSKCEGMPTQRFEVKRMEERMGEGERERKRFGSSFHMFSSPWACPVQTGLSQECCLFYLKSSLWSSDLLLFYFAGFSLPCLLATAILDSFSLFYLPNSNPLQHSCLENPITRGVW